MPTCQLCALDENSIIFIVSWNIEIILDVIEITKRT